MQPRRHEHTKKIWLPLLAAVLAVSLADYRGVTAAEAVRDLATAPAESVTIGMH